MPAWPEPDVLDLIARALHEDIGAGDITTQACVPADARASGRFLAKSDLVVAGIELLPAIYSWDPKLGFPRVSEAVQAGILAIDEPLIPLEIRRTTGQAVAAGDVIATISGPVRRLLERERVALNFLQRLSGVATLTRRFVEPVSGTGVKILDTRKTTPGWRRLEKQAVSAGGGTNHRFGLFDAVLIKENHVAAAGGIRAAVEAARRVRESIEVEVRNRHELEEALEAGAARVLLDNMTPAEVAASVARVRDFSRLARRQVLVEVSGGITLANVAAYAEAGPDFISIGALTHSAPAADISFLLEGIRG